MVPTSNISTCSYYDCCLPLGTDRLTPGSRKRTASDRSSGPDDSTPSASLGVSKRRRTVKTMADGSVSVICFDIMKYYYTQFLCHTKEMSLLLNFEVMACHVGI